MRSKSWLARSRTTVAVLLALLVATLAPAAWAGAAETVEVQILSINDLHGNILPKGTAGGAAYLATYFYEREMDNPNTLIVSGGDMIGGSPAVSSLLQDEPTIELLQFLGMDLGVPGNHEFDEGLTELQRMQWGGQHPNTGYFPGNGFPLIAANVIDKVTQLPVFPPYVVKTIAGVPIGFIGVVTLEAPSIVMPAGIASLNFIDPVEAINKYSQVLQGKGVQTIVVVAHEGGSQGADGSITGAIRSIAENTDKAVDVIISGHSHTVLNGQVAGKLVVQAGQNGANFADVDLIIDKISGDVIESRGEIVKVLTTEKSADPRVATLVAGYEAQVKPLVERVLGTAAVAVKRQANAAGESALGDLVADSQRVATNTQIAFMNPGGIRADLDAGPVTWGQLYTIQPFANDLVRMTLTGDQIRRILNQQWQQQNNQVITRFLQISGFTYTWDDRRPLGNKIVDIKLVDGTPIDPNTSYSVVANIFIATGGDGFTVFKEAQDQAVDQLDLTAFVKHVQSLSQPFTAEIGNRIQRLD